MYETAKVHAPLNLISPEGGHIGDQVFIAVKELIMNKGAQINAGAKIIGMGTFYMGIYATVGYNTVIVTGTDVVNSRFMNDYAPATFRKVIRGEVYIGDGAFIGPNVTVSVSEANPIIQIGANAVVMANSYVGKDIKPSMIYGRWGTEEVLKKRPGFHPTLF